jgi:hypothetical protein
MSRLMTSQRPIQWYHFQADLNWPDGGREFPFPVAEKNKWGGGGGQFHFIAEAQVARPMASPFLFLYTYKLSWNGP